MNFEILKDVYYYIPVVVGLSEVVKRAVKVESAYMPLVAVLVGVGVAQYLSVSLLVGAVLGLAGGGLYDFKSVIGK